MLVRDGAERLGSLARPDGACSAPRAVKSTSSRKYSGVRGSENGDGAGESFGAISEQERPKARVNRASSGTSIPGSNPGGASKNLRLQLPRPQEGHKKFARSGSCVLPAPISYCSEMDAHSRVHSGPARERVAMPQRASTSTWSNCRNASGHREAVAAERVVQSSTRLGARRSSG
jgi:hypothetical protein